MAINQHIKKMLLKTIFFRRFYENGYLQVKPSILFINFIFQRIFRVSSDAKFSVHYTSTFLQPQKITFGKGTAKNFARTPGLYIQAGNYIHFGSNILIGPNTAIISANHDVSIRSKWAKDNPIKIGDNVWIAANVVILPGVELGDNVIVGAGSVVTKSFKSNTIIAGNPAKVIRHITKEEV
ncbi:MAG: acyltransferase [Kordiimonadaceae bacterium]|nr:acyltransferase [Kordiimonadaceae bacterium]